MGSAAAPVDENEKKEEKKVEAVSEEMNAEGDAKKDQSIDDQTRTNEHDVDTGNTPSNSTSEKKKEEGTEKKEALVKKKFLPSQAASAFSPSVAGFTEVGARLRDQDDSLNTLQLTVDTTAINSTPAADWRWLLVLVAGASLGYVDAQGSMQAGNILLAWLALEFAMSLIGPRLGLSTKRSVTTLNAASALLPLEFLKDWSFTLKSLWSRFLCVVFGYYVSYNLSIK